jgi:hypothetical protein
MMSSSTYRVIQEKDPDGSIVLSIRECYTRDGAEKPYQDSDFTSWTENAIAPVGSTLDELKWELQKMLEACDKAIIDIESDRRNNKIIAIVEKIRHSEDFRSSDLGKYLGIDPARLIQLVQGDLEFTEGEIKSIKNAEIMLYGE